MARSATRSSSNCFPASPKRCRSAPKTCSCRQRASGTARVSRSTAQGADEFIVSVGVSDAMLRSLAGEDVPLVVWGAVSADAGIARSATTIARRVAGEQALSGRRPAARCGVRVSDVAAMAVTGAFNDRRLVARRGVSLVGYNNISPAAHFSPALTTISQKTDVAGAWPVEKLMQQIDGARPRSTTLPTEIVTLSQPGGDAPTPNDGMIDDDMLGPVAAAYLFAHAKPAAARRFPKRSVRSESKPGGSDTAGALLTRNPWFVLAQATAFAVQPTRGGWSRSSLAG